MPTTSSPWSKALEALGRFGSGRSGPGLPHGTGGTTDVQDDLEWRRHATSDALFAAWSPSPRSPWRPYAKPVLFAALDARLREDQMFGAAPFGPLGVMGLDRRAGLAAPHPPRRGHAILLDLDGPSSVAYAAWLVRFAGHEPVPLFNNWPHPKGLLDMGSVLATLLHYAPWAAHAPDARESDAPPVFLTDRRRLGTRPGNPLEFDNRYFHLASDLPSAATLRRHGITDLVYVRPEAAPAPVEVDDLNRILHDLGKGIPLQVADAAATQWRIHPPRPWSPAVRDTGFSTTRDPRFKAFRRAAAGGFGKLVPVPSSSGG